MAAATCVLCGAALGSSASLAPTLAQASVRADYIEYAAMWEWTPQVSACPSMRGLTSSCP